MNNINRLTALYFLFILNIFYLFPADISLFDLPKELVVKILNDVEPEDVSSMVKVNRLMNNYDFLSNLGDQYNKYFHKEANKLIAKALNLSKVNPTDAAKLLSILNKLNKYLKYDPFEPQDIVYKCSKLRYSPIFKFYNGVKNLQEFCDNHDIDLIENQCSDFKAIIYMFKSDHIIASSAIIIAVLAIYALCLLINPEIFNNGGPSLIICSSMIPIGLILVGNLIVLIINEAKSFKLSAQV